MLDMSKCPTCLHWITDQIFWFYSQTVSKCDMIIDYLSEPPSGSDSFKFISVKVRRQSPAGCQSVVSVPVCPQMRTLDSSSSCWVRVKDRRPIGFLNLLLTKAFLLVLLFGTVWSITGQECLPGGNLFGIVVLFICSVLGGKLLGLIHLPTLPPFPPLLGMLLAGLLLRNVPYVGAAVFISPHWSAALRNVALSVILTRAGLGLDPSALRRLKAVCVRVAVGPCVLEACVVAVVSHFLLHLPWIWGFILGFVLAAVSPAVVVPSMLLLQREGYGVEKGIPTLLMAAGSFDDILAITGFSTCLGIAFSTGSTWMNILKGLLEVVGGVGAGLVLGLLLCLFPSSDQEDLVLRRTLLLVGFSVFSVFFSHVVGFAGAGGLCTLVLSFLAALGWKTDKAAIGSKALDLARDEGDETLIQFGLDVLTLAVLAILITAPIGALGIGLAGPRLLARQVKAGETEREAPPTSPDAPAEEKSHVITESKV
uniref:Cation/H+ exchanger transmembrane domain-containing protein n=1 Tax=Poecilia reticulata TaxID=8081 RepID=A0A3P9PGI7_POERE